MINGFRSLFFWCLRQVTIIAWEGREVKQLSENSFGGLNADGSIRRRSRQRGGEKNGGLKHVMQGGKKLSWMLPAALGFSHTQTLFSPHEMTFWDVQKLDRWQAGVWHIDRPERGDEIMDERGQRGETWKHCREVSVSSDRKKAVYPSQNKNISLVSIRKTTG